MKKNINAMKRRILVLAWLSLFPFSMTFAQTNEVKDTLRGSVVFGEKSGAREAGTRIIKVKDFKNMVSAIGNADVVKYIQTLPGVSTGGEGSSAFYVRGGNLGSNLVTLDGVPLYGSSHLLGFTSVYSPDVISNVMFQVGGFTSEEGNLTASHIKLTSEEGEFNGFHGKVNVSNFILGTSFSTPLLKDKISFIGSVRLSPVGLELRSLKGLSSALDSIGSPRALVYDAFGKVNWIINDKHSLSLSAFNSMDAYSYDYGVNSEEHIQWSNLIGNLKYVGRLDDSWSVRAVLSYNKFSNAQGMVKILGTTDNNLAVHSSINEATLSAYAKYDGKIFHFQGGVKGRYAKFNPATSQKITGGTLLMSSLDSPASDHVTNCLTGTVHSQFELEKEGRYDFRASGRLNFNRADRTDVMIKSNSFDPEASLLARVNVASWLGFEATADWTTQYYHTLEGVPLGWSLDLIVPSDNQFGPEKASQYYAGMFMFFDKHRLSLGCYTKKMTDLVYFTDATALFSSAAAGWRDKIDIGKGTSKGLEFLYEKIGDKLNYRIAYTWSKTDRTFQNVNMGVSFPAKFNRPHILNVTADYSISKNKHREITVNTLFTYQSGHWETVASGYYQGFLIKEPDKVQLKYFTTVNNFEMPPYIRLDFGCSLKFNQDKRCHHTLNVGIYNVLNRHNPFSLTYDTEERTWKKVSIFPIMPSLNWTIEF